MYPLCTLVYPLMYHLQNQKDPLFIGSNASLPLYEYQGTRGYTYLQESPLLCLFWEYPGLFFGCSGGIGYAIRRGLAITCTSCTRVPGEGKDQKEPLFTRVFCCKAWYTKGTQRYTRYTREGPGQGKWIDSGDF
jgi:hypothetical protein